MGVQCVAVCSSEKRVRRQHTCALGCARTKPFLQLKELLGSQQGGVG